MYRWVEEQIGHPHEERKQLLVNSSFMTVQRYLNTVNTKKSQY